MVSTQSVSSAVWSSDGARLVYRGDFDVTIRVLTFEGNVTQEAVLYASSRNLLPRAWSRDRRTLVLTYEGGAQVRDIWIMPFDGEPEPYLASAANEKQPSSFF